MKLKNLSIKDKGLLRKFLGLSRHELAVYAFENIYIWKGLFDIYWKIIENSLCVFFKDKFDCFLYLAPLAKNNNPVVIKEAFKIMDGLNKNKEVSRIENIEEEDVPFYQALGYACSKKSYDYLCRRTDLVQLKGNRFKSKRSCFNYFTKHYAFHDLVLSLRYRDDCIKLYNSWMQERKTHTKDRVYLGMLEDSLNCLESAFTNYSRLGFIGRLVKINKETKAFTFGFRLNPDTFCILYEIADLSIKGLSQFIFRRFSNALEGYKYINIMDDSGLENLKQTKLSYHPAKLIQAYIAKRKNG
ncbi:MAG: phosphatidylglycerol lysyltransferase domain-containing protein [Candidatus Omnitrophota bacterium]